MPKDLTVSLLLDFYGNMLTEKQREVVEFYYNDDLSLSEIAENEGITRQGVRDAIKRAEMQLREMEERLGFVKRTAELRASLREIYEAADRIKQTNSRCSYVGQIEEDAEKILQNAQKLLGE
jgi:predicted DNA-binding protein YlxM (UPF0122 family)